MNQVRSNQPNASSMKSASTESKNTRERHASPSNTGSAPPQQQAVNGDTNRHNASNPSKPRMNPPPTNGAGAPPLNPRSCVTCRKRKVRCDKRHPCINCTKAGIECIFPGPGRAPRRSRKPPDTELLARLRRLEGVVKHMGRDPEEEIESVDVVSRPGPDNLAVKDPGCDNSEFFDHLNPKEEQGVEKLARDFGRLVVVEGRSRYVANRFWTALSEEVLALLQRYYLALFCLFVKRGIGLVQVSFGLSRPRTCLFDLLIS